MATLAAFVIDTERALTVVLVEQNLDFVAGLSDRVLIIQKGEIVKSLAPGDLGDAAVIEEFVGVQAQG